MSDVSQGPGWWQASDGKWYPPKEASEAPAPGWWLASDGKWYPPKEAEKPPKPGWWLAADGKWYPPQNEAATTKAAPQAKAAPGAPAKAAPKPAAGQPATAGKAPAKAAGKPAAKAPAKAAAGKGQPVPAKGAAKAAPAKAAKGKPAGAKPAAKPAAPAAQAPTGGNGDEAVRRASFGLSPEEQIRIRDEQSRRDAQVLAGARAKAATRALGTLQDLIDREKATQGRELRPSPAMERAATPAPSAPAAPAAVPAAKATPPKAAPPKAPAAKPAKPAKPAAAAPPPMAPAAHAPAPQAPATPAAPAAGAPGESPLLEVKPSPLFSDTEHIGERLVIFNDRVELHDRNDRVLQVIAGPDIADVVVSKKFTGSTVTVEAGTGEVIVAKGLKPDQADEIRAIILKRTRQGAPDDKPSTPAGAPRPAGGAKPRSAPPRVNEADLVAKLTDLHRAGVLSDDEFEDKKALVGRLARGESLAATPAGS